MGSSDGETIAAPAPSQNGGSRSECRQTAGQVVRPSEPHGICCRQQERRRRERLLDSVALIGQGSDALVYLVRSKLTGRMSALKVGVYAGQGGEGGRGVQTGDTEATKRFTCVERCGDENSCTGTVVSREFFVLSFVLNQEVV